MTTITIVDSLWRHNENCCYANTRSQGQASCLLTLEFKCHLRYCSSQEVGVSLSHSAVLHYTQIQVMASCIVAPSHYLNQCGLIIKLINKVMWHLSQWIIMKDLNIPISKMRLKLICWDNFTPLLEIIYSAVIIVFFVIVVSWYLLSPSLIPSFWHCNH